MTTNEIIRLENIRRNFIVGSETVHALRGVNFTINSGEFVTIMGTSGSGNRRLHQRGKIHSAQYTRLPRHPHIGRVLPRWYFCSEYG